MDDDFDPLAPVYVDDADGDFTEADAVNSITDPQRIVRLWFEEAHLTRVFVSPNWHHKLDQQGALGAVFDAVLAAARIRVAEEAAPPPQPDLSGVDFTTSWRFGRDPFTTFQLAFENVNRRWQDAARRHLEQPVPTATPVQVGQRDTIVVHLDEHGHLSRVIFDEDWLDEADVQEINDGVLRLAQQAHAEYEPVVAPADELGAITREQEILMAGFRQMLTGREPR